MQQILEEYGEAAIGVIVTLMIIGLALFLFRQGGIIDEIFSDVASNAI